jgi:hypothetical protein
VGVSKKWTFPDREEGKVRRTCPSGSFFEFFPYFTLVSKFLKIIANWTSRERGSIETGQFWRGGGYI